MQAELAALKDEFAGFRLETNDKLGKLETEVRVVKHDFVNLKDMINGVGSRVEKVEEKIGAKLDIIFEKVAGLNVQQQRGAGFVAGVIAAASVAAGLLLFLAKLLFR